MENRSRACSEHLVSTRLLWLVFRGDCPWDTQVTSKTWGRGTLKRSWNAAYLGLRCKLHVPL
eukprot:1148712-Pelagomonas_calceolata.AAC.10